LEKVHEKQSLVFNMIGAVSNDITSSPNTAFQSSISMPALSNTQNNIILGKDFEMDKSA
jgi:hypothetical protein